VVQSLNLKLITKNIAQMNAAELLLIDVSWKNTMRKKLLGMAQGGDARSVDLN
jgi:hypothetical protein